VGFSAHLGIAAGFITHGYLGLDGFFLLSGITLAHANPAMLFPLPLSQYNVAHITWRKFVPPAGAVARFYLRRIARLFPVNLAVLALLAVALPMANQPAPTLSGLLQGLFLVQSWAGAGPGWLVPAWGLSALWAGSLLFPLLAGIAGYFDIYVTVPLLMSCIGAIGLALRLGHGLPALVFAPGFYRFLPEFLAGILARRLVHTCADYQFARRFFGLAGPALLVLALILGVDFLAIPALWMLLFAPLMQHDTELPPLLKPRRLPLLAGHLAFAFTMSLAPVSLALGAVLGTPSAHPLLYGAALFGFSTLLAALLHAAIERPARLFAARRLALALASS
jgi:peptidoglycan/LPS O-acetylase OafA/YrhL